MTEREKDKDVPMSGLPNCLDYLIPVPWVLRFSREKFSTLKYTLFIKF